MAFNPLEKFPSFKPDLTGMISDPMLAGYYSAIESIGERLNSKNIDNIPKILDEWWNVEMNISHMQSLLGDLVWSNRSEFLMYALASRLEKGNEFPKVQYLTSRMLEENSSPNNRGRVFANMVLIYSAQPLLISTNETTISSEEYNNHINALEEATSTIEHPIEKVILKQILIANRITREAIGNPKDSDLQQKLDVEVGKLAKMLMYASNPIEYIRSHGEKTVNSVFEEIDQLFG